MERTVKRSRRKVSILVFLEWPLGPPFKKRPTTAASPVSILVFLEWPLGQYGWDKYSKGSAPFQSLFFWNGLWDRKQFFYPLYVDRFQSLFFWNGLWDTAGNETIMSYIKSFQSLFFWNGLWDWFVRRRRPLRRGVSILVFLEWPLGPTATAATSTDEGLFQSLFFWNGLWDSPSQAAAFRA